MDLAMEDAHDVDVDARFLLANERTLLAWVRTALALVAAGVALAQLNDGSPFRTAVALTVVALGVVSAIVGARRYAAADRALRAAVLPARGYAPLAIAVAVAVAGALAVGVVLADHL